jgi:hypothetical protein
MDPTWVKRVAWTVATLCVIIAGFVWLAVTFSFNALLFITIFGAIMFVIYRWRFGGDLGLWGRKEEIWSAAPSWSPGKQADVDGRSPSAIAQRNRWVVLLAVFIVIAVAVAIAVILLMPESRNDERFPHRPATDQPAG